MASSESKRKAIILLSNDLSHPALSKQQYAFSWRINRVRPLVNHGYRIILVAAGGRVSSRLGPSISSLRPEIRGDDNVVMISPPILRVPMLWLLQSLIITPLFLLLYSYANALDIEAIFATSVSLGAVGKVLNRFLGAVLIVDYGDPDYLRERSFSLLILRFLEGYVLGKRGADAITCIDPNIRRYVKRYGVQKVEFLPPGGFWKGSQPALLRPASEGIKQVLYAGHVAAPPTYRLDLLIEAAPRILEKNPNAKIVVVGDGEYRSVLKRRASELKISSSVKLTGAVPYEDAKRYIAGADVTVQLLNDMCLGTKVLDYFASGRAVVSCGKFYNSYDEFLVDGENCLLVPPDANSLADAVNRLLSSEDLRNKLGRNAFETVSRYDWDSQAEIILSLMAQARLSTQK